MFNETEWDDKIHQFRPSDPRVWDEDHRNDDLSSAIGPLVAIALTAIFWVIVAASVSHWL